MLVSQYIYTACGKDRNGAFSLFSKSKDINDTESAEIREMMMYKAPAGLPIEPTQQQIEDLFPKKFAYFFLSTGRACIAQTSYIGKVYSDNDPRTGNYIIHAFVFEKNYDCAPYSLIGHEVFKRCLTYQEWHDDPIPDFLPQIDIPENGTLLTKEEIHSFYTPDRLTKLKLLIEAVISSSLENVVHFHEEHLCQVYWLKTLNLCLPKAMLNNVSICSHFVNSLIPGNISSQIQIRINRPEGNQFNYAQDVQRGKYSLDFVKNIFPNTLQPSRFTENIVNLLIKSEGPFPVVQYINTLNSIINDFPSLTVNQAVEVLNLSISDYTYFTGVDEIFNTFILAVNVGYHQIALAEKIWKDLPQLNFTTQQILDILACIYKTITDPKLKIDIIDHIFTHTIQLNIRTNDVYVFSDDLKSKVNFIFENYLDYLKSIGFSQYISQNQDSPFKIFFMFEMLTKQPLVKKPLKTLDFAHSDETRAVKEILLSAYFRQSTPDLDMLIAIANKNSVDLATSLGTDLLAAIASENIHSPQNLANISFAFDIISRLYTKPDIAQQYLWYLLERNQDKEEMMLSYIDGQTSKPDFYANFEKINKEKELMSSFARKKDAYRFKNQQANMRLLTEYFGKYFITGDDTTGLFQKKLNEYLQGLSSEKRLADSEVICREIAKYQNVQPSLIPTYKTLFENIFSASFDKIYEKCRSKDYSERIDQIYRTLNENDTTLKPESLELYQVWQCGIILDKYDKDERLIASSFFGKVPSDANQIASLLANINQRNIDLFADYYFATIVKILVVGYRKEDAYQQILKNTFGKIIEKGNITKISDLFITYLEKSKVNNIDFIAFLVSKRLIENPNPLELQLSEVAYRYLEKLDYSKRQDLFEQLKTACDNTQTQLYQDFFDKFNKEHPKKKLWGIF